MRSDIVLTLLALLSVLPAWPQERPGPVSPARVLVILNTRSPDSVAIADYYVQKRRVPPVNVCRLACPTTEECTRQEYQEQIQKPVQQLLAENRRDVDFLLLTKGVPIRMKEGGYSTDSMLATMGTLKPMSRNPISAKTSGSPTRSPASISSRGWMATRAPTACGL